MADGNILDRVAGVTEGVTGLIDNTGGGNWFAFTQTMQWQQFTFWLYVALGLGVVFFGLFFLNRFYLRFNKRVLVKKLKGSAVIDTYMDRGRIYKDKQGKEKLDLLRIRKTCPIPSYKFTQKMGKADFYEAYLDDDGNLKLKVDADIEQLRDTVRSKEVISLQELAGWRIQEMKLAEERFKKKSFLEKHSAMLLTFMGMVAVVAMVWITMNKLQTVSGSILELAKAVKSLGG